MMNKYLFFDIECADGYKICAFGYIVTDLKFKILSQEDIKINPKVKVLPTGRNPDDKFKLGYRDADFVGEQTFDSKYEIIKNILENNDYIVVGHSVKSDCGYLKMACIDYKLKNVNFTAIDIQKVYQIHKKDNHKSNLGKIGQDLKVEYKEDEHTALSGATFTMECFKALHYKIGFDSIAMINEKKYTTSSIPEVKSKKERKIHSSYTIGEILSIVICLNYLDAFFYIVWG